MNCIPSEHMGNILCEKYLEGQAEEKNKNWLENLKPKKPSSLKTDRRRCDWFGLRFCALDIVFRLAKKRIVPSMSRSKGVCFVFRSMNRHVAPAICVLVVEHVYCLHRLLNAILTEHYCRSRCFSFCTGSTDQTICVCARACAYFRLFRNEGR